MVEPLVEWIGAFILVGAVFGAAWLWGYEVGKQRGTKKW